MNNKLFMLLDIAMEPDYYDMVGDIEKSAFGLGIGVVAVLLLIALIAILFIAAIIVIIIVCVKKSKKKKVLAAAQATVAGTQTDATVAVPAAEETAEDVKVAGTNSNE